MNVLARAGLLGFAEGSRSMVGIAAQVVATPVFALRQPERTLSHAGVKAVFVAAALGEVVADKLPSTPSRLQPQGLLPRLVLAGAAAVLAARAADEEQRAAQSPPTAEQGPADDAATPVDEAPALPPDTWPAVAVAVGTSAASSFACAAYRRSATRLLGRDWPGALLEDLVAVVVAAAASAAA